MSDTEGQVICSAGFVVSGLIAGSVWGGTTTGPAAPLGVLIGGGAGALWAALICSRPKVKEFFQKASPTQKLSDQFSNSTELRGEMEIFISDYYKNEKVDVSSVTKSLLSYLESNQTSVVSSAKSGNFKFAKSLAGKEQHGAWLLGGARAVG